VCYYTGRVVSPLVSSFLSGPISFGKEWRGLGTDGRDHNMRESFVVPVNSQRREMAGNVILYVSLCLSLYLSWFNLPPPRMIISIVSHVTIDSMFTPSIPKGFPPSRTGINQQFYTISSGFRLRTPMPPYLPPAERSRQRLVEGIRGLDVVKRRSVRGGGRHLLFFAYALAMQVGLFPRLLHPHLLGPHSLHLFI